MKPILKYPGSKQSLALWIASFFPKHRCYLEPYCGSAALFFNKEQSPHEVLNDINGSLVNLFRVMRNQSEELAAAIMLSPWSEEEYNALEKHVDEGDALEQARRFLVRSWQGHGSGVSQTSGWKHNGLKGKVYPTQLWKKLPRRLLDAAERLQDAEIRNKPALEMIAYYNAADCLIYADPPYLLSTRNRKYYSHEMTDDEHIALLNALDVHKGPVVLSGYAHPLYDERLSHWNRVTMPSVTEHGNTREEVLWLNAKVAMEHQKQFTWEETA